MQFDLFIKDAPSLEEEVGFHCKRDLKHAVLSSIRFGDMVKGRYRNRSTSWAVVEDIEFGILFFRHFFCHIAA